MIFTMSKLGQEMIELWAINNGPMGLDHEINLDGGIFFFFAKQFRW